jgi:RNA polymerase sigma-70 factor (ECF subfamily)
MLSQNKTRTVIDSVGGELALKKLILSAKQGDTLAFEEIYKKLFIPLYRYTNSRLDDKDLVDDICQQVFLKFYQSLSTYEPEKSPLAYLFTIAKHLLINHKAKKKSISFDESLFETTPDDSPDLESTLDTSRLASKINEYLPSLTHDEQEVIRLYFYAELSYKEISDILEKEEVYLRKIKERALKKLRLLTQHLHDKNS